MNNVMVMESDEDGRHWCCRHRTLRNGSGRMCALYLVLVVSVMVGDCGATSMMDNSTFQKGAQEQVKDRQLLASGNERKADNRGSVEAVSVPWAEQLGDEGKEAYAKMSAWLNAFFRSVESQDDLFPPAPKLVEIKPRVSGLPQLDVKSYPESLTDPHEWSKFFSYETCGSFLSRRKPKYESRIESLKANKRYLIVIPVGDEFDASQWVTHPEHATYDLVVIYYGKNDSWNCSPLCKHTIRLHGTKWYLLNAMIKQHPDLWSSFAQQYQAIMVADDDLKVNTCSLNRAFEIFEAYGLLLAQMSLCKTSWRSTYWNYLYKKTEPESILRYITFVEIMAPIFRMDFFEGVVAPSLYNAYTGWGLDFAWPFILRYPKRHIAVIDDVCMVHSSPAGGKEGEGNLYSVPVPYSEREEEERRKAEYHYYPSRLNAMGLPFRPMIELGVVYKSINDSDSIPRVTHTVFPLPNRLPKVIHPHGRSALSLFFSKNGYMNHSSEIGNLLSNRSSFFIFCVIILVSVALYKAPSNKHIRKRRFRTL